MKSFRPGDGTWLAVDAPVGNASAVFEDDGETAYFYAVERAGSEPRILDSLHIYNVASVVDPERESSAEIRWTSDGRHTALFINGYAHAVFDFQARAGCCRSGFPPPPSTGWSREGHEWKDAALAPFEVPGA